MLTSPTHLRDKLVELDNDISLLSGRVVSLLGFRDSNAKRVDDNVRALRATPPWTLIDIRGIPPATISGVFIEALSAPKVAMLVDAASPLPTDASLLIRALYDSHDAVRWADGSQSPLPADRILYVIAAGARSVGDLPPELRRIDYMTFIKPPE